jgi:hypothetical protein
MGPACGPRGTEATCMDGSGGKPEVKRMFERTKIKLEGKMNMKLEEI